MANYNNVSWNTFHYNMYCIDEISGTGNTLENNDCIKRTLDGYDQPIDIDGNVELAAEASSGDGSELNPYVIQNKKINVSGWDVDAIRIANTDKHFVLNA